MNPEDELEKSIYKAGQIPAKYQEKIPEIKHQTEIYLLSITLVIILWLIPAIKLYLIVNYIGLIIFTFGYLFLAWASIKSLNLYFDPVIYSSRIKESRSYFLHGFSNQLDLEGSRVERGQHIRRRAVYTIMVIALVYLALVYKIFHLSA